MAYLGLSGIVLLIVALWLFLWSRSARPPEKTIYRSPLRKPYRPRSKRKKDLNPAQIILQQEILEKRAEFKIYSLAQYATQTTRELSEEQKEILYKELKNFPLPSGAALKLSELLKDPYADSKEVAAIAATDPVLSARLLAVVNSAYFRPRSGNKVTSIHRAILLLGFNQVRNLLFHTLLENAVNKHSPLPKEDIRRIWLHSATVSVVAGFLAKKRGFPTGLALTAGLMHDIGKFFLPYFQLGDEGSLLLQEEDLPPFIKEEQRHGFNHTVIGSVLCHIWKLPPEISQAVAFHHVAELKKFFQLSKELQQVIALVAVADYICHFLGEAEEEKYLYQIPEKILQAYGFPLPLERLITPKLKKEVEKMVNLLESFQQPLENEV